MTTTTTITPMVKAATPLLTDAQRTEIMGLIGDADSVELKLTVPGGFVCSGSLKRALPKPIVRDTVHHLDLDALTPLGPIFVMKLRMLWPEFPQKLVVEMWMYPDGTRILELSTKAAPVEALLVAEESRAVLQRRGIPLTGEQQTKTKRALEFFASTHTTA